MLRLTLSDFGRKEEVVAMPDVLQYAAQLKCILKPSVRVCVCDARGMVGEVGKYLSVHGNLPKLKEWTVSAPP